MLVGQARNWRRSNGKRNLLASVGMCLGSKLQESAQCQTLRSTHVQNWILKSPRRWNHCDMCQSFLRSKWVQDNLRCLLRMKMSGLALSTGNRSGSKLSWLIEVPTLRKDGCRFLGSKNLLVLQSGQLVTTQPPIKIIGSELGPRWPSPFQFMVERCRESFLLIIW
jgi:hypothetical protein